jgi:putative acetyltransferase
MDSFLIRKIRLDDNPYIEKIIKDTFPEFNMPLTGTTFEDKEIPQMFESYQNDNEVYYILEEQGNVVGGGGIKPLKDSEDDICELQKMYLSPEVRGKGYGKFVFNKCLEKAKKLGFKKCYLESASQFKTAIQIYEKSGFQHLEEPLGNTGHYSCGVWMIKDL